MDVAKEPVIGASVVVMGSTNGCITDFDGKFSLEVSEFPVKLQISYIGYKSQEVTVRDTKLFRWYYVRTLKLQMKWWQWDTVRRKSKPDRSRCLGQDG